MWVITPAPEPRSILDTSQWAWVDAARAAVHDEDREPIFTTFPPNKEPEVWPAVDKQRSGTTLYATFAILLIAGALLWRWNKPRIRWVM